MFDGLKKKFTNFINGLAKKEEEVKEEAVPEVKAPVEPERHFGQREQAHVEHKPLEQKERKSEAKVSAGTKIKGIFLGEVKINEKDVDPFMDQLKIELLKSDVNYDAAEKILDAMRKNLIGKPISSRGIESNIRQIIRQSILDILSKGNGVDLLKVVAEKREKGELPYKILFIGPNGAGKTTTIAKMANMLKSNNITCIMSASDTFRAAAIEQLDFHANKIGTRIVKGRYGADPASVAFDAIASAKANKIDVVLIDSAGRQDTNKSLIEEVKKIARVAKPDLKIFIGESVAGNALLDQVKVFDAAVKIDGIILTKLDLDAKGGNTLSILSETNIPVMYFGTGEKYSDLMGYKPQFIADNIVG